MHKINNKCYFYTQNKISTSFTDLSLKTKNMKKQLLSIGFVALTMISCNNKPKEELTLSGLDPKNFQTEVNQMPVNLYTLKNKAGMEVCITNFGGRIVSVMVPDKNGAMKDVVLGFDSIADYINVPSDFGASIGRYANRIKDGKIVIDGKTIQLPQNNFGHCLHGGPKGWQYQVYEAKPVNGTTLELVRKSPDGDENFPGNVTAKVTYTLTDDNAIDIKYEATTDKKTVINMTNHSYFNLSGDAQQPITDNLLYVNADKFTPVDSTFMTTGEIVPVAETPMDFTTPKTIGKDIDKYDYKQLKNGNGYDHNWVLNTAGDIKQVAAKLTSPTSGITLEVYTDEPGIQVYTGNFLNGTVKGKKGIVYKQRVAVCLESQHYPDSPNKPEWPSVILEPGQTYHSHCIFKFNVEK
ncbi:MAG: galactose-1-epimerase [Bacteroidetes bacterium]|jgi:aldose 1-epimerase|nr:galactose-1-epimerase [Bacteroidota bacterium]